MLTEDWRLPMLVNSVLVSLALFASVWFFVTIKSEVEERRDQSCRLFEADHLADVVRLRRTYAYLVELSTGERQTSINRAVRAQLPQLEEEARVDSAPEFCDAPGVGLPEPDPKLPVRPGGALR